MRSGVSDGSVKNVSHFFTAVILNPALPALPISVLPATPCTSNALFPTWCRRYGAAGSWAADNANYLRLFPGAIIFTSLGMLIYKSINASHLPFSKLLGAAINLCIYFVI